jgi:hypothetical protein
MDIGGFTTARPIPLTVEDEAAANAAVASQLAQW